MDTTAKSKVRQMRQVKISDFYPSLVNVTSRSTSFSADVSSKVIQRTNSPNMIEGFTNISYLPMYYQNVRSIPARTDLRNRIKYSGYKCLCFTESRLGQHIDCEWYFPLNFVVYRRDRNVFGGGVAILVHEEYKSFQIGLASESESESVCVKIELKPVSLVIYLAYVNEPERLNILLKHYEQVRQVISSENHCRVMVIGDFDLHDVIWNFNDAETFFLPQNIASHTGSTYFQTASDFLQKIQDLPMFQLSNLNKHLSECVGLGVCE